MEDINRSLYRLTPAFDRGLYGGFIGGIGAGCWGSIMYYQLLIRSHVAPTSLLIIALEIIIYGVLIGTLLGITTQIFTSFFLYLATAKKLSSFFFNEVSGGFVGGTITGIAAGALGGWFFGQKHGLPIPSPHQILLGQSLSSLLIIWIATYGYEKKHRFLTNVLLSFVLIFFVIGTSVAVIESSNAFDIVIDLFAHQTPWRRLIGGIIFGLCAGPILGLSIGLTMLIFRLREPTVIAHPNRLEPSDKERISVLEKKHVFISYCRENTREVAQLYRDLVEKGERVWWDKDIKPGQDWKWAIHHAIDQSYAFVLCWSKEAEARVKSGIYPEISEAIAAYRQYAPGNIYLIPVRFSASNLPLISIDDSRTLGQLQYLDLFPPSERGDGLRRLIEALQEAPGHPLQTRRS